MGILTLYTTFTEKGCFLIALEKDKAGVDPDNTFRATSTLKRYAYRYFRASLTCLKNARDIFARPLYT